MTTVTRRRWSALALAAALLTGTAVAVDHTPAFAAGSVTVTGPEGGATADPDYATTVTVRGSGFQSIQNGFGGVYVLFGWAGPSWQPSAGGVVGEDFRYVPDTEAKDNAGFQRFVAFAGSDTEGAAHAVMGSDGSWSVDMVVPGATFESRDRDGNVTTVDCLVVTCGILTIGAHGVKNANNETFTPIAFVAPQDGTGAAPPAVEGAAPAPAESAAPAVAAAIGEVRVGLMSESVNAGTSVAFTGQGFTPGEQVVAVLDNGLVSVGPLAAGASGEVAGVMPVPRDVRGGTHVVTLTGAASGSEAQSEVQVIIDTPMVVADPSPAPVVPLWVFVALLVSIALALTLVIVSAVVSLRRGAKRRRERRAVDAEAESHAENSDAVHRQEPAASADPGRPTAADDDATMILPLLTGGRS